MPAKLLFGLGCALAYAALACFQASAANAVGYINIPLKPGFNLISNPLSSTRDTVAELFDSNIAFQEFPSGLTVFLYRNGAYRATVYDSIARAFLPTEPAEETIRPGEAFWVYNPSLTELTLICSGEVLQGTLINPLESGYNLVGSIIPRSGTLSELAFPAAPGDIVYLWDAANQRFRTAVFDDLINAWTPFEPRLETAQGFIVRKILPADWIQFFSITQLFPL